mmetsp:Transcript_36448/g.96138  ORF Transcript_36448/g.96138 Transcript_36448/m.96138 type:complete len:124 (+) Transcript_36448:141-512(+)
MMIVLRSYCHLCHGRIQHSFEPGVSMPTAQYPSARCRSSQPQLLLLHVHPAALGGLELPCARTLSRLYPHVSGSSPGGAVTAFLSEFLIFNGLVTRALEHASTDRHSKRGPRARAPAAHGCIA